MSVYKVGCNGENLFPFECIGIQYKLSYFVLLFWAFQRKVVYNGVYVRVFGVISRDFRRQAERDVIVLVYVRESQIERAERIDLHFEFVYGQRLVAIIFYGGLF